MTMTTTPDTVGQIEQTYRRMVKEGRYAPMAPSDGMGTITGPIKVAEEANIYAEQWWEEEESLSYYIGCPDWSDRPALIFTVEAARLICGMQHTAAIKLLKMAVAELEAG